MLGRIASPLDRLEGGPDARARGREAELTSAVREFEAQLLGFLVRSLERAMLDPEDGTAGLYGDLGASALSSHLAQGKDGEGLGLVRGVLEQVQALDREAAKGPVEGVPRAPLPPRPAAAPRAAPEVRSSYGPRRDPLTGAPAFHHGIDLGAASGDPVAAAADGIVVAAARSPELGNHVILRHPGGFETLYAHLSATAVAAGEVVSAGTVLGTAGATGKATGPHLHFEVRKDGAALDPREVIGGARPLWVWPVGPAGGTGRMDEAG